jgi:hypothetical protein
LRKKNEIKCKAWEAKQKHLIFFWQQTYCMPNVVTIANFFQEPTFGRHGLQKKFTSELAWSIT